MRRSPRGVYLVGTVALALGVLMASSAQALPSHFVFKNTSGAEVAVLKANISAQQLGRGTLTIPGLKTEINCEKFSVQAGTVINTATDAEVKLLYEECTMLEEGAPLAELAGCEIVVNHEGDNKRHITTKALLLPAELTDGSPAILAEKIEATVLTEPEKGCILPKTTKIKGELCLKIDNNETTEPELLSSTEIQSLCVERPTLEALTEGAGVKDKLLFGTQEAFVNGNADVHLSGEHNGYSFGVSPEKPMLCKTKAGACEAYKFGTELATGLEKEIKFVFLYEGEELEPPCRVSAMSGKTTKEEGEVLVGELSALSFKECGGGLCTVTSQHLPYRIEIKATSEGNGTMALKSGGTGAPAFAIKCLGMTKCIYGASEVPLTLAGGTPAKLSSGAIALKREEGSEEACGETGAKWEGVAAAEGQIGYEITKPTPLFVRLI